VVSPPTARVDEPAVLVLLPYLDSRDQSLPTTSVPVSAPTAEAVARRFTVVSPQGIGWSWNAGSCCGPARVRKVDDVAFLDTVIDDIITRDGVDPRRVFVAGFSNGGFMAYRYACETRHPIAGIAVINGDLGVDTCRPKHAIDALVIHQTGDEVVPYAGTSHSRIPTSPGPFPPVETAFATWRRAQKCASVAQVEREPSVTTTTHKCGRARARLVKIEGGAHDWPVSPVDATQAMIDFFDLNAR
jgi:polyhydroxybutyrate depolymerase